MGNCSHRASKAKRSSVGQVSPKTPSSDMEDSEGRPLEFIADRDEA